MGQFFRRKKANSVSKRDVTFVALPPKKVTRGGQQHRDLSALPMVSNQMDGIADSTRYELATQLVPGTLWITTEAYRCDGTTIPPRTTLLYIGYTSIDERTRSNAIVHSRKHSFVMPDGRIIIPPTLQFLICCSGLV